MTYRISFCFFIEPNVKLVTFRMQVFVVYSMHIILHDVVELEDFMDGIFSQNVVSFRLNHDTGWSFETDRHEIRRFFKVFKTQISLYSRDLC